MLAPKLGCAVISVFPDGRAIVTRKKEDGRPTIKANVKQSCLVGGVSI